MKMVEKAKNELAKVGVRELRQDASAILRRVKDGEIIEITEHGTPIAHIGPAHSQYEMALSRRLITPAVDPGIFLRDKPMKLKNSLTPLSEVLLEMRDEEKY